MSTLHHIGWVVRSIDAARSHFEHELGLEFRSDEVFPDVRTAFFGAGASMVELLEPRTKDSDIARFLARRGEGIHHLALRVQSVARALADAPSCGLRAIDKAPHPGSRGTLVALADPRREGGILVQYVEER
ncbi:MAG TPA: VOC family protein [Candidatus Saccharimonadales bacterium]|nr:VOC family protein [Candidatus Saccharimonadales bacterium]